MKLTPRQYAVALYESVAVSAPNQRDSVLRSFIELLAQKNRLSLLPRIVEQLKKHQREQSGIQLAKLTTAKALPNTEAQKFKKLLATQLDTDIELETMVDPKLLGGAIVQVGDTVIDGSISHSLAQLHSQLTDII